MLLVGRFTRPLVVACLVAALVGCGSDDAPDPTPTESGTRLDLATMRTALLQGKDIGPTWTAPQRSPALAGLVALCGGDAPAPPVPGNPTTAIASAVDEGEGGAQSLDQIGLVYESTAAATAGLAALRSAAAGCPTTAARPAQVNDTSQLVGYTETVATEPLTAPGFTGFAVVRHKRYEARKPATGDTAVAVLHTRNAIVVVAYSIYRLGAQSTGPQFTSDWRRLVGTVVDRLPRG